MKIDWILLKMIIIPTFIGSISVFLVITDFNKLHILPDFVLLIIFLIGVLYMLCLFAHSALIYLFTNKNVSK